MAISPPQPSNQLSCLRNTLEHLRKAHLASECGFRFLFYKKSGILLIKSLDLPWAWNVIGQLCGSLLGQGMTEVSEGLRFQ